MIQAFSPSRRQPPSTRVARVVIAAKSEPAPGSVSEVQPAMRPATIAGTKRRATSGWALRAMLSAVLCELINAMDSPKSASASTSTTRALQLNDAPLPPNSVGTEMPKMPAAAAASPSAASYQGFSPASSLGVTCSARKRLARSTSWSSISVALFMVGNGVTAGFLLRGAQRHCGG